MSTTRQPAGIPVGGQFAATTHSEADVRLPKQPEPIMASVALQQWRGDYAFEVGRAEFDATVMLANMGSIERAELEDSEADDLFHEAVRRGLVKDHDGPFDVHVREALDAAIDRDPEYFQNLAEPPENRPLEAILEEPLSPFELGARMDKYGYVTGRVEFDMADLVEDDVEGHNDRAGQKLVGSELLMDLSVKPVAVRNGKIICEITGDASAICDGFEGDELDAFEDGQAWDA